jgi:TPR repeat protein
VRADAVVPDSVEAARRQLAEHIARARRLIARPDIATARAMLEDAARAGDGEALYLLAETYDPNRLAGLGVTDAHADAERARYLYGQALDKGYEPARARLEQLR